MKAVYDVVVIGSGYGGAIAASVLARAELESGRRASVCLLERGRELPVGAFPETLSEALGKTQVAHRGKQHGSEDALYWVHAGEVSVLHGCGLGGTSLINAGVALRPDDRIWQDPVWPAALTQDAKHGLAQGFARATRNLGVATHPDATGFAKHRALQRSATALGHATSVDPTPLTITFSTPNNGRNRHGVAQHACNACGNCVSGCNTGAKNTLAMNYLPDARDAGAEIFCEVPVRHVEADADGGYRVFYEPLHQQRALFAGPPLFVRARVVVLAAGVLGTTEILLRSKRAGLRCSDRVGERVSGNGDMLAFAHKARRSIDGVGQGAGAHAVMPGPSITGLLDRRAGRPLAAGYVIQEGVIPGALGALVGGALHGAARAWGVNGDASAGRGNERAGALRRGLRFVAGAVPGLLRPAALQRTQTLLLMSHDAADGVIAERGDGVELKFPATGDGGRDLHADLQRAAGAIGGTYVPMPSPPGRQSPVTVHPLGGAVMADDARRGVTDHSGRVFRDASGVDTHPGLYVCDASLLPRSLGVNPLLTIAALAERNARLMAAQQGWALLEPSRKLPAAASAQASADRRARTSFRFSEKLVGHLGPHFLAEQAHLRAENERPRDGSACELVVTISTSDCAALIEDPVHTAAISGSAKIPFLSDEPLVVSDGVFHLFVDDIGERSEKRMRYRMRLTSVDGRCYELDGYKDLASATGRGLWADTTILFTDVYALSEGARSRVAQGVLRVTAPNFARELMTMRSSDERGRPSLSGIVRYGLLFASGLAEVYRPHGRKRSRRRHLQPERAALPQALIEHGRTSLAYSAVSDPSVHSFDTQLGSVLYGRITTLFGARTLVCGDALCAPEHESALLREFLAAHPGAGFFQVSERTASQLHAFGYAATQLGIETSVDLTRFSLQGNKLQNLRSAYNKARREGLELVESDCATMGAGRMMRISRAWMQHKTVRRHEIAFFARPMVYVDEPGVRKFFALRDGEPVGYVYLDPLYEHGQSFGYAANILRHEPDAPSGVCDALLVQAALTLQSEGLRELNLGMSPFFRPPASSGLTAANEPPWLANTLVDLNWRLLNGLFHYRGIAFHKRRWRADERAVYYAGDPREAFRDFYAAARMTGVL